LTPADLLDPDESDDSAIWTPEIVALRFRYSDGHGWRDRWDSREQNALPAAVEIAYRIEPLEATRRAGSNSNRLHADDRRGTGALNENAGAGGTTANLQDDTRDSLDFDDSDVSDASREEGHLPVVRQIVSLSSPARSERAGASARDDAFTPAGAESHNPREAVEP
jgi:hypothetical protein